MSRGTLEKPVKLAIVGCGAIAEHGHLPALAHCPAVEATLLVDRDEARAQKLADQYQVPNVSTTTDNVDNVADAAVIALPPALHATMAVELMSRGIHVLVEKPMAMSSEACDQMIAAAKQHNATLAIGLVRRFRWAYRYAKQVIDDGILGPVQSVTVREGGVFDWPVATPFFLTKQGAGGGVLADAGAHVLDALLWWFGDATSIEYRDDDFGGVEADCELDLAFEHDTTAHVELSRTRAMPNTTVFHGERGVLTIAAFTNDVELKLHNRSSTTPFALTGNLQSMADDTPQPHENIMADQLVDFARAIQQSGHPVVSGEEGRRSVALIEACYAQRKRLEHAWVAEGVSLPSVEPTMSTPTTNIASTATVGGAR